MRARLSISMSEKSMPRQSRKSQRSSGHGRGVNLIREGKRFCSPSYAWRMEMLEVRVRESASAARRMLEVVLGKALLQPVVRLAYMEMLEVTI